THAAPIARQFVPAALELDADGEVDPLNEEGLSPVPHVVHRYPGRVLLLCASSCFAYCRFCTRKRHVGRAGRGISFSDLLRAVEYIRDSPQIHEVILSGGDPMTMSDRLLQELLERIRQIPHVKVLRLGSRAPVVLPQRITDALCQLLQQAQPLYFMTHINHPDELCPESIAACRRLVDAGIPLVNQTVLLRGVNDNAPLLQSLFERLLELRIRPYYLHQMDLTRGTAHFRTRLEDGVAIMARLRGVLSGLAMPHFVVDLPGGHGKIPLLPEYVECLGDQARLRAPDGTLVEYPNGMPSVPTTPRA
ncbi:MAG: KamA family radical SAM protein, partial [Geobacteraceae bacterium]|nr:KamA family radical SAM protein [Geobacteraceae bacterium]